MVVRGSTRDLNASRNRVGGEVREPILAQVASCCPAGPIAAQRGSYSLYSIMKSLRLHIIHEFFRVNNTTFKPLNGRRNLKVSLSRGNYEVREGRM